MTRILSLVVLLFLSTAASGQQHWNDLTLAFGEFERIGSSDISRVFAMVENHTGSDIQGITVDVALLARPTTYIGGDNGGGWSCANQETPYRLICTTSVIRAGESSLLQIYVGPVFENRVQVSAYATWVVGSDPVYTPVARRQGTFPREVIVSNTGDAGPGSLRAAIDYVNDTCPRDQVGCRIAFRIETPVPERGWYTILPNSPLPAITAPDFEIDGATQTRFGGDTNPLGPEIALDGSALGSGHGLQLAGDGPAIVRNLAIGGFPGDGIAVTRRSGGGALVTGNYIGTDATGLHPLPNRSRGISFDSPASNFDVRDNLISNNVRSGVYIFHAYGVSLTENTIRANSAGVFLGPESHETTVERNSIVDNAQFGVAVARYTTAYQLIDNSITRNGFIGIDHGLDGFSGYDGSDSVLSDARVPPPRLLSATYDPVANVTTIIGLYADERVPYGRWTLTLYRSSANDGQGEASLGHTSATNGTFTFTVPGDLRGQFITATGFHEVVIEFGPYYYWTSEFSEAVEVR
jgi:parallel beta-helix repeat protein